ncbi:acyltransferase [Paenibacillus solani]|uniref:acyltransferase n=1 Tax=Paenibacillus solani TaxID=1705565 RepID=UPI003D2B0C0A
MGDNCLFNNDGELTCGKEAQIRIGSNSEFGCRYWIVANTLTFIDIGEECIFSKDCLIRSTDGHSIFDIHTGENINSSLSEQYKKNIIIEDHVWFGAKCSCFYGAKIGSGSIVGAHSLVKRYSLTTVLLLEILQRL